MTKVTLYSFISGESLVVRVWEGRPEFGDQTWPKELLYHVGCQSKGLDHPQAHWWCLFRAGDTPTISDYPYTFGEFLVVITQC